MAFQTSVFRGGEWVTQTVDVHAVLKANSSAKAPKRHKLLKAPQYGILTQTAIESQLVNLILPVRLRSSDQNDVAFVLDFAIQIRELGSDGRFKDIIRKNDFGSRIRNACVIGSFDIRSDQNDRFSLQLEPKTEPDSPASFSFSDKRSQTSHLPPQMLMVTLECGDCVFLFVRQQPDGKHEFVTVRFPSPRKDLVYPGVHLAVDPSSRYMVSACHQDFFIVYELETRERLNQEYLNNRLPSPIKAYRPRSIHGVIHKVTFLYPRPGDEKHIILLLIVVRNGKSRMLTYEWMAGEDLKAVFAEEQRGHRMPPDNQLPTLLIPLTVKSAFIAISPEQIVVCDGFLHGQPNFEAIDMENRPPTDNHHGRGKPLWTAWSRPFRLSPYFVTRDCMYLAREDGVVIFIEADSESALDRSTFMDTFDCNISSAFTCLFDQHTDILVLGSDSGPGGIWKVPARNPLEQLELLPDWSPTVDFVTTDEFSTWNQATSPLGNQMAPRDPSRYIQPDRLFAISGQGKKGAVTEYRHGLEAGICLDMDYMTNIKETWLFPSSFFGDPYGHQLLLSMPDRSGIIKISHDFTEAVEPDLEDTPNYDLTSTTLAALRTNNLIIQITERCVVLLTTERSRNAQFLFTDLLVDQPNFTILDAAIAEDGFAVSGYTDRKFRVYTFTIDGNSLSVVRHGSLEVDGDITCLSLHPKHGLLLGIWKEGQPYFAQSLLNQGDGSLEGTDLGSKLTGASHAAGGVAFPGGSRSIETIASISYISDTVVLGTRSGEVLVSRAINGSLAFDCYKFGMTTATVTSTRSDTEPGVLVTCDQKLAFLGVRTDDPGAAQRNPMFRVWPTHDSDSTPPVDFAVMVDVPAGKPDSGALLMISGTRLLIAELDLRPRPVHRRIPIEGTPVKMIYSPYWKCLVVAVNVGDKPTLLFINPDTGENIGRPVDKHKNPVEFISGLGRGGDRIYGLTEWEFKKSNHIWRFILVSTRDGRVIVVSPEKISERGPGHTLIRYSTRFHNKKMDINNDRPAYSILGYEEGIVYCIGQKIYWDILDTDSKKLRRVKEFELESPATSLRIVNGKIMALTVRDSIEIIDQQLGDDETMGLSHVDPKTRNAVHMIEVSGGHHAEGDPTAGIVLVADRDCGVGGLWVPWQIPQRDCETVFESELPVSIRRFRRGRTRPLWDQGGGISEPRFGRLASTIDDAEILGISLDGSLHHFTLLKKEAWRLLRFIQNIALTSEALYPFTHEEDVDFDEYVVEPRADRGLEMHVDGDMLRRCRERMALPRLITRPAHLLRFAELLDELVALDGGQKGLLVAEVRKDQAAGREKCFRLAYDVMDYFLRPAV